MDPIDIWFALIDELHYTPKWRWRKRRELKARLDLAQTHLLDPPMKKRKGIEWPEAAAGSMKSPFSLRRLRELHAAPKNTIGENLRVVSRPQLDEFYAVHSALPVLLDIVELVKARRARFAESYRDHKTDEEIRLDALLDQVEA